MVQVFVQVEKGYENQVSDLVKAMPGHYPDEAVQQFPIMVGSYTTGIRHAEALSRQLADQGVLPADAGRRPFVADSHFVAVQLPATAAGRARAERLYATYGDQLVITVGQLTYPLARARFLARGHFSKPPVMPRPGSLTGGCGAVPTATPLPPGLRASVQTPSSGASAEAAVPSSVLGPLLGATVRLVNTSSSPFQPERPAPVAGELLDARTGEVVAVGYNTETDEVAIRAISEGGSVQLLGGVRLATCSYDEGYLVPPGRYRLLVPIGLTPEAALRLHRDGHIGPTVDNLLWVGTAVRVP
jgi:hypothetical protein